MKFISWNVNGLRACVQKGFLEQFSRLNADFFCLQETKMQQGQLELELPGYLQYWNSAEKKGYSGTAIFTKHVPLSVSYGLDTEEPDREGRVITLEYPEFYLVNCYTPNAQRGLARINFRMEWDEAFRQYLARLDEKKPVILCGDLNVAHQEIDLKNPGPNRGNAGFSDQERESFSKTLSLGFTDTFRYLNPNAVGAYTWWSYMFNARQNNAGWRIDYFLVSDRLKEKVYETPIYSDILGSDHCPVGLEIGVSCNGSIWVERTCPSETKKEEKPKEKTEGKTIAKIGALALAALLLIGGIARIQPAASLQTEAPNQSQTEPTAGEEQELITLTVEKKEPQLIPINSATFSYEVWTESGIRYLGRDYDKVIATLPASCNFWIWLELNHSVGGSEFNNAVHSIEVSEALCGSAMAAQRYLDALLGSCRFYREDGSPGGWLLIGYLRRSTGFQLELTLSGRTLSRGFVVTPVFSKPEEMSTEELADYAAHLSVFENAEGGINFYRKQAKNDPPLAELEKRTDAGDWIAVLTDRHPELKTRDFLRSVFPQVESVNLRGLSQAEANRIDIKRLVWWALQDEQLAKDLFAAEPNQLNRIWTTQYSNVYPAFRRVDRKGADELAEYLYSYQNAEVQKLAAVLYDACGVKSSLRRYNNYLAEEARFFLKKVTEEEARSMTTEELVALATNVYLVGNKYINGLDYVITDPSYSSVVYPLLGVTGEDSIYASLVEEYPVLRELERRDDAADWLFTYTGKNFDGNVQTSAWFFLRQRAYIVKMTPAQVEIMLQHATIGSSLSKALTYNLVSCTMQYIMPTVKQEGDWYAKTVSMYPVLAELEKRSNAVSEFFRYMRTAQNNTPQNRDYVLSILLQPVYASQLTGDNLGAMESLLIASITESEAKDMTTAQLAEKVTAIRELLDVASVAYMYYADGIKTKYNEAREIYAVIRELETRQDAVSVLLEWLEAPHKVDRDKICLILLIVELEPYLRMITPQQGEIYVKFAEQYLWKRKLSELATNNALRYCLRMGFWERELSQAESGSAAEAAYEKIVQALPALTELENRKDFLEELLFFLDSSNLSVTQAQRDGAKALLCLGRFYSRLTSQQQLEMAQMLLGVSFADGTERTEPAVDPANIPLA